MTNIESNQHATLRIFGWRRVRAFAGAVLGIWLAIDACHAGNALGDLVFAKGDAQVDITQVVNELSSAENGAIVYASSTGTQLSQELEQEQNGAFTEALVEGLDGQADLLAAVGAGAAFRPRPPARAGRRVMPQAKLPPPLT